MDFEILQNFPVLEDFEFEWVSTRVCVRPVLEYFEFQQIPPCVSTVLGRII